MFVGIVKQNERKKKDSNSTYLLMYCGFRWISINICKTLRE